MDFEEMKVIWDSQNQEPLYTLDETALHAVVRRRNQEFQRCAACRYAAEIGIGLACGVLMFVCAGVFAFGDAAWLATLPWPKVAVSHWDAVALFAAAGIWFYFAAYMRGARRRQSSRGEEFAPTMRGDIDRALAQVGFQIRVAEGILWRGFVPVWVAAALWVAVVFRLTDAPAWTYVFMASTMAGALVTTVSGQQRRISERYQPHQRELESLRRKLLDPQP